MKTLSVKGIRKDYIVIAHFFLTIFVIIILFLYDPKLSLLQGIMIVLFIENCILSLLGDFFNIYQIFLGTSFLFFYARIFLDAIGFCDFRTLNVIERGYRNDINGFGDLPFGNFYGLGYIFVA